MLNPPDDWECECCGSAYAHDDSELEDLECGVNPYCYDNGDGNCEIHPK